MTNKLVRHQILEGNIHDPHLHTVAALGIFLRWSLRNLNYTKFNKETT